MYSIVLHQKEFFANDLFSNKLFTDVYNRIIVQCTVCCKLNRYFLYLSC